MSIVCAVTAPLAPAKCQTIENKDPYDISCVPSIKYSPENLAKDVECRCCRDELKPTLHYPPYSMHNAWGCLQFAAVFS